MRVLVVGGGGREHALAWKIAQSPLVDKIYCAPGNGGIAEIAECLPIAATDTEALLAFAGARQIGLTVVGPEAPLIAGIVDAFEGAGLPIFGPSAEPARIEGSKSFAKDLMRSSAIPTAEYWTCESIGDARARLGEYFATRPRNTGVVIKADGLASGKGVTVAAGEAEANAAIDRIMGARVFGSAGDRIVIEERLSGEEVSVMAITDGTTIVPLAPSQDHKRIYDGDTGPNTGGMGAYTPVPIIPEGTAQTVIDTIIAPAVAAIRALGIPYRGALYAGIIVTEDGPKCIEFNCRFGDPETQAVLPLLESDIVPLLLAVTDCTLDQVDIRWSAACAAAVVAASRGYPGEFETGKPVHGLEAARKEAGCIVFHSGTRKDGDEYVTAGGRVLCVTGIDESLVDAVTRAYSALAHIDFDGMQYRPDIAARALHTPRPAP